MEPVCLPGGYSCKTRGRDLSTGRRGVICDLDCVDTLRFALLNCRIEFELDQKNRHAILLPTFLNI